MQLCSTIVFLCSHNSYKEWEACWLEEIMCLVQILKYFKQWDSDDYYSYARFNFNY